MARATNTAAITGTAAMTRGTNGPDELPLDPLEPPPLGGSATLEEIARLKREPGRFGCLGLGCLPWIIILVAAAVTWYILR